MIVIQKEKKSSLKFSDMKPTFMNNRETQSIIRNHNLNCIATIVHEFVTKISVNSVLVSVSVF